MLRLRELARAIVDAFAEHGLLTYASAISFRALVALVPLLLLGLALLGALGLEDVVLGIARWLVAIGLLTLAVGTLVRYAPAERPEARWASAGSALVIGAWIVASLAFRWWVGSVADFESAVGILTVFLLLTAYVFVSPTIFIVGVQLDEILRKERRRS